MIRKLSIAALCGVLMLTANCTRLDRLEEAREFADVAVDASRVRTRVIGDPILGKSGLPGTSFDAIPTSGTASFLGASFVAVTNPNDEDAGFALVGRSDLTVNFGSGTNSVRGTLDDFQSSRQGEGILDVTGALELRNGVVGAETPNRFTVDYIGNITVEGTRYTMQGDMLGRFRGTRTEPEAGQSPVRALSAVDANGIVTGGGARLVGRLTIVAEN